MGGFSTVTPSGGSVNATAVAQAVWSYSPRSLTDIQSLTAAIQSNDPGAVPSYSDLQYVPVPYYAGQVTADQVAAFIDNAVRNYNLLNPFVGFINNNPYNLWPPNAVGAFLSSQNMSQTSVALLLANAGATQMAQALNNVSGNYTNVAAAFNMVNPSTGATVMNLMSASQVAFLLSYPVMSITQAALILGNPAMSATQGALILSNANMPMTQAALILSNPNMSPSQGGNTISAMAVGTAVAILNIAINYNITQMAAELSYASSSQLVNIAIDSNVSVTTLNQVITSGMAGTAAQALLYGLAQNYYYNKWVNTVTANAGSTTISTNVTVSRPLYAQNLTIASGVTVTCGTQTCFFVAQNFNNYGTIVSPYGAPGGVPASAVIGNYGGTGGGGLVVIAVTAVLGTLNVSGNPGGNGVSCTAGSGSGSIGSTGVFYVVTGVTVPLGGTGGEAIYNTPYYGGTPGPNGGGGGASDSNYQGATGGVSVVYVFNSPNAMVTYILQGLSDWWLINVLGKAPSSTTPLLYMYGSGGGAGAQYTTNQHGGGGGGGGGEAVVYGYDIVSGTINAAGGVGGACISCCSNCNAGGGGGGGGGLVFIFYGATSGNVTANVAGGAGGSGYTATNNYSPLGLTGANGTAYIAPVTVNG